MLPAEFKKATCFDCDEYLKFDTKKQIFTCPDADCGYTYTLVEYEAIFDHEEKLHATFMEDWELTEEEPMAKADTEYDLY